MSRGPGRWQRVLLEALEAHEAASVLAVTWHEFDPAGVRPEATSSLPDAPRVGCANSAASSSPGDCLMTSRIPCCTSRGSTLTWTR